MTTTTLHPHPNAPVASGYCATHDLYGCPYPHASYVVQNPDGTPGAIVADGEVFSFYPPFSEVNMFCHGAGVRCDAVIPSGHGNSVRVYPLGHGNGYYGTTWGESGIRPA